MIKTQLNKRLVRDLTSSKSQVLSIGLIVAIGVGALFGFSSTHASLKEGRDQFYQEAFFADIFARVKKAPSHIQHQIANLPGVQSVQEGLEFEALLQIPGMEEPAVGQFLSLPPTTTGGLNRIRIIAGRAPHLDAPNEVLVSEGFLNEHQLQFGATLTATLNGQFKKLTVVGSAVSPEHMIALQPGSAFPDDRHFSLVWMDASALGDIFDMTHAFNKVSATIASGANLQKVRHQMEAILAPYGAIDVFDRTDQTSYVYLNEELKQLRVQSRFVPLLFFLVAAFVLNIVLSRRINAQRSEIATLKAVGYLDHEIAGYYFKLAAIITLLGSILGIFLGLWLGSSMIELYSTFYHIPKLVYRFSFMELAVAIGVSLLIAMLGTYSALKRIFSLAPAEAMRPPAPTNYHSRRLEHSWLMSGLQLRAKMTVRGIFTMPLRSLLTSIGISFAIVLLVAGLFWGDSIDHLVKVQYNLVQRETASLQLTEALSPRVVDEVARLPGVLEAEGYHNIAVKVRNGVKEVASVIKGLPANPRLFNPIDGDLNTIHIPEGRLIVSQILANQLGVRRGEVVEVEAVTGKRPIMQLEVDRVVESFMTGGIFTSRQLLAHWLRQGDRVNQILLRSTSDPVELYLTLKQMPHVLSVTYKDSALRMFNETSAKFLLIFAFILSLFAAVISFGITYNNVQIALAERDWELATLRILGFRVGEVFRLLIAEIGLIIIFALPFGCILGYWSAKGLLNAMSMDAFVIPFVIYPKTYLFAVLVLLTGSGLGLTGAYFRLQKMNPDETLKSRG